jgi:hypothetical protein
MTNETDSEYKHYKLRAECIGDAEAILNELHRTGNAIKSKIIPGYIEKEDGGMFPISDCELEFYSQLSLEDLVKRITLLDETEKFVLHVPYESVNYFSEYDGERFRDRTFGVDFNKGF